MNRTLKIFLIIVALAVAGAFGAYAFVSRPTKAPTQTAQDTMKPVVVAEEPKEETPEPTATEETDGSTFRIVSEKSTASFSLEEDLRGTHITVLGTTKDVSGEVSADRMALADAKIGTIRINARTFVTDSEQRNNAIRRMILKTEDDANEFIEFVPKSVTGLTATAEIGKAVPFSVTGDLTVSGQTKEATFKGTVTFVSETELSGSVESNIHYPDWNIAVPNLPFLANVDQDVTLKLEFIATK
jgi:polyisoprenoid-binding protein YceI